MPDFRNLANSGIRNLVPYQPGKPIEELERELGIKSSIKMASNENPLGPSPKAMKVVADMLHNAHYYPDGGCFEFKLALSRFLNVDPVQITVGNGSENLLELIVKAYLHQDDNAVLSQYAFLTIPILVHSYGVHANVAPAKEYGHDIDNLLGCINEKTRVLFLVNPNNPTGTYTNVKDFNRLLESVPPHILLVVDEAYGEYISQPDYPDALSYLARFPNLIVLRTFSKVYGLAGLRLGYSVSSPDIADILNRTRLPFNVNSLAAAAGSAALMDDEHINKSVALNREGMQQLKKGLQHLQLNFIPSVGNFLAIDVMDGRAIYQKLLYEGIIVRPLHAYDLPKHIRVTIGTPEQNKRFLEALERVLRIRVE